MSKRVKKRFTSDVNVIDFHPYLPQKKQRVSLLPRNKHQENYLLKLQDESKSIVFAIGPAGTGKTLLAVQNGIKLYQEGKVDKIIYQVLNMDPKTMTEDEKVDEILNLVYINLINTQIEKFKQFVETPMTGLFELFNFFGSQISLGDEGKINVAKKKFINRLIRFENNPTEFFKYEIKNFNKVTNNMIKKLSKLYHIAIDNKTNESVIDWGLYTKNLINKNGTIVELSHKPKDVKK